jgi:hypothetical protein
MVHKIDRKLTLVFFGLTAVILIKSFLHVDGYLSPDSTKYLRLAQNLLDGNGFYITDSSGQARLFAHWPIGYPFFIFIIAKLTGLSVFWASKTLNILIVFFALVIFKKLFKQHAYIYGILFFLSSTIETLPYTWSEVPFIFGLILLSYSLYKYHTSRNTMWIMTILFACIFLFFVRYIGLFSVGVVGAFSLFYAYKKEFSAFWKLIVVSIITVSIALGYLFFNYTSTGYATGTPRTASPENAVELTKMLIKSLLKEINLLVVSGENKILFLATGAIVFISLAILIFKMRNVRKVKVQNWTWLYFIIVGTLYWLAIVGMRWTSHFDDFNFRLFGPSTMLVLISIVAFVQYHLGEEIFKTVKKVLIGLSILSIIINVPLKDSQDVIANLDSNYINTERQLLKQYEQMKGPSIVAFGDEHLLYLRTDLNIAKPHRNETIQAFLHRVKQSTISHIFIVIEEGLNPKLFHPSIIKFMNDHSGQDFVQIR